MKKTKTARLRDTNNPHRFLWGIIEVLTYPLAKFCDLAMEIYQKKETRIQRYLFLFSQLVEGRIV
jgi:hypothetical protein